MKFSFTLALALIPLAWGAAIEKRASTSDVATTGYASTGSGTTGGKGGATVTVSTLAALTSAAAGDAASIILVSGTITGNTVVRVGSNKSIIGKSGAALVGVGLRVLEKKNVIIRNLKISKVLAEAGDAIGIQAASQVWVDHVEISSDRDHDKDFYDGLLDVTHGCTGITVSYSIFRDHWKGVLVGHSDSNASEDTAIRVTFHNNYWYNLNSRLPSFRFGQGHIYGNVFENSSDGINTRVGAQLLVQNNIFSGVSKPIYATDGGFAVAQGNDFGGKTNTAPAGTLTSVPYAYTLDAVSSLRSKVVGVAGANLGF
ncbi:polysaccharide lyase family 1 protein [Botryobasidium botryosum FD-172 SS1]|uniref:pectate lyase n=1 Tax=Botryobasidium botryosum (strain FD-172 SS1) TaxID=930990 RepID=A0A067LZT0_BOTB1|nr:polysaccharide lyase family 1 protein [Botryobasidium botryosum FD-172 SS1]